PARQRAAWQPPEPRLRVAAPAERRHLPRAHVPAHEPRRNEAGEEGQDDARPDRVPGDALLAPERHHVGTTEHEPGDGRVEQEVEPRGAHALLEEEIAALRRGHGRPYSVSSWVDVHAARREPAPRRRPGGRARGPRRGATAAAPLPARRRPRARPAAGDCLAGGPGIELRAGVVIEGLVGEARDGGRPTVTGVRLADGSTIPAAIVVDATGRRSRAPGWLAALGAPAPYERSAETGIFYYTRFYRLRRGRGPRGTTGLVAGDLGWVKLAIFPGDNRTLSITVGAPVDDAALRGLAEPARFAR